MNDSQQRALHHPCLLAVESMLPQFWSRYATHSVVLTVNAGYE